MKADCANCKTNASNVRFYLDILMFVFFGFFFDCKIIAVDYHVWGGLVFFLFTVWHVWLNRRWLTNLAKRKKRWQDWTDILLIVSWLGMLVTGILLAKEFGIELHDAKPFHKCFGALSLLFAGIHIGFHWNYLREHILRLCPVLHSVPRLVGTLCLAGTLCFGAYSYAASDFGRWLTAPVRHFEHKNMPGEGGKGKKEAVEFSPEKLAGLLVQISAMLYVGAYVVKKTSDASKVR